MTPREYLMISIANAFGLDKTTYAERIQWVQEHEELLEGLKGEADEIFMYSSAVKAYRDMQAGNPIGFIHYQDAIASGIQCLSVMSGCYEGLKHTGLIKTDERPDVYRAVYEEMLNLGSDIQVSRTDAKQAVMTACYGSKVIPKSIFGDDVNIFYQAVRKVCPGAFDMLDIIQECWNPAALAHRWTMPDLHEAVVPVLEKTVKQLEIDELNHYRMSTIFEENKPQDSGISLCANVTHSIDAFVLREMIRYCSKNTSNGQAEGNERFESLLDICASTGYYTADILFYEGWEEFFDGSLLEELKHKETVRKLYKPFHLVTVHDCFGSHVNNARWVSYWYKQIMSDLAKSDVMQDILRQLTDDDSLKLIKDGDWHKEILESEYGIC